MNEYQKKVAGICIVVIILMGLFPPWIHTFKRSGVYSEKPAQYSFIFSPPTPRIKSSAAGLRIDYGRLLLQWFIVLLASSLIIVFKKTKNVPKNVPKKESYKALLKKYVDKHNK